MTKEVALGMAIGATFPQLSWIILISVGAYTWFTWVMEDAEISRQQKNDPHVSK